ncbi:MAG: hypothetical protein ABSC29_04165 [Minisyncoccia bacterium]|jgi:hypothetical protein
MKPLGKVKIQWSPEFAYAIGLLVTDGCLYGDGRHINLTSKDKEQIKNFLWCLKLNNKIGMKHNGARSARSFTVQFGDIVFYRFLNSIGVNPRKSKTIADIKIPNEYFFDFLRGHFDGDGTFYSYFDPRWKSSYLFYTVFASASGTHINWLRDKIFRALKLKGHISKSVSDPTYKLKYAKTESLKLLPRLYYNAKVVCLSRKRRIVKTALAVINKKL